MKCSLCGKEIVLKPSEQRGTAETIRLYQAVYHARGLPSSKAGGRNAGVDAKLELRYAT